MSRKSRASASQGRSDQDTLNLFLKRNRELAETSLGRIGFSVNNQITYDRVGITTVLDQPDEDAIRSFLLTFRQFVSEKEPLFLGRVYGVCYQHLEQDVLRNRIKQMREIWASVQQGRGVSMNFYGVELSGSKIFDVWANGWYFHSDADYRQLLEQLPPIAWDMLRAHFINFIIEVMRLVHDLCKVILNGFEEDSARPGFILLHPA